MEIKIVTSSKISESDWLDYTKEFNKVFDQNFSTDHFLNKYIYGNNEESFHSLLYVNDKIVGACTVIPCQYIFQSKNFLMGLTVDVFISESHRENPFVLRMMYKKLVKVLKDNGVDHIMAVPNDAAYGYWKNIVKWKDVGRIHYYGLPLNLGALAGKKYILLDLFSTSCASLYFQLIKNFSLSRPNRNLFTLDRKDSSYEGRRYIPGVHKVEVQNNIKIVYRVVDEEGVRTVYLIDFFNLERETRDAKALRIAIKFLIKKKIDIILYVGKIDFMQLMLLKIPERFEPKPLYFIGDSLKLDLPYEIMDIDYWDFGLYNYDVR